MTIELNNSMNVLYIHIVGVIMYSMAYEMLHNECKSVVKIYIAYHTIINEFTLPMTKYITIQNFCMFIILNR